MESKPMNIPVTEEPRYLYIVVDNVDDYSVAMFQGFVDDVPVYKRIVTQPALFVDLRRAAECAQELTKRFPAMIAVTKKGEKK
jgi:hypothetical protein